MDLPGWLEMALGAQHGKGPGCIVGTILMHEHIYVYDIKYICIYIYIPHISISAYNEHPATS